ncbi:MAG TPA: hypothetical protein PKC25_02945, partial [Candidatus Rifleibacterium sp.]|nr:hypothetical protein [Candidatus Rifleibacterium sp.]
MKRSNNSSCRFLQIWVLAFFLIGFVFNSLPVISAGGGDSWQKTIWSEKSELFMEYDPPVAGQIGG